jgi:transposase
MKARCSGWYNTSLVIVILGFEEGATGMTSIPIYVGLDYHTKAVQVCVEDGSGQVLLNSRCPNWGPTIIGSVEGLGPAYEVAGCAIEVCCGAADLGDELIREAGWSVDLAHPGYVSRMKQSPDKHDWGDARLLADLERVGYVPRVWLAPQEIRELRRLIRYRQYQVQQRRDTKLKIGALLRDHRISGRTESRPWTRPWLAWLKSVPLPAQSRWVMDHLMADLDRLNRDIRETEAHLEHVTANDSLVIHLRALSGVGPVTSWILRAEVGWFHRFRSGKQLSRFCGLSPRNVSSGERQADAGLVKAGNTQLRSVLIESAHRLIRYDKRWSELALKMLRSGKPKSMVAAAVANRWVRWMFHQVKDIQRVA